VHCDSKILQLALTNPYRAEVASNSDDALLAEAQDQADASFRLPRTTSLMPYKNVFLRP
jgi:hypothetical protein